MMSAKQLCLRVFIGAELAFFLFYTIWGAHGIRAIIALKGHNSELERRIAGLQEEIAGLQGERNDWLEYPFYREKYARERLQMAHKDDELILL